MSKGFIVMAHNGLRYEDSYNWPVAIVDSKESGERLIADLEAWRDKVTAELPPVTREFCWDMMDEEEEEWERQMETRNQARDMVQRRFGLCPDGTDKWEGKWSLRVTEVPKVG